ncbi:HlyD family efflux transporter periplasmic adaptor subunit [Pseudomonas fontis]|uniref:HlyD family efflux transporter periplasmic adaptor subunit n=1 Tax=Pseudomonas fontis TaxID=2942633 RepID=A0ABT5NWC8_9PSED|nr:HlyD family efflux transporter periplasmic adaptor subunit [Pseudomonas fontis]MDD0976211.1 HlyD family efflux transporter periplasmic adaptor subunit [Pseudomonas fontis]MDD0992487.1 HlyD family efflux transporter periplasmic adaptor subunit [Pseudomonas fontis]
MQEAAELPLPPLREDLRLSEAASAANGEPAWVIQDTVINRFYRIGWLEFECLLRWGQTPQQICEQVGADTALKPEVEQVLELRRFLEHHQLLRSGPEGLARLQARESGKTWLSWNWWLHHYLFFRIPLLRPQRFLVGLSQLLAPLFTRTAALLVVALSVLGIVLVLHQWDTFVSSVVESFSTEGLFSFALALIVAKTLHELGHALVATRLGLRVGHMGIAFVVLWPMLYTDTGESWKLRSARQRLAIASAGIITELSLAGLATLGWALCEPGAMRNALLYLATTSWALSLALNASPFMRFDGYFILSDLLDFPNLHERSSALARVSLRRGLLGMQEPWPEAFSPGHRRLLIGFAMVTWLYRLVLFLGIAYAVYVFFFKLLGIVLFIVELSWFIAMPIIRELKYWFTHRQNIASGRRRLLLGVLALGVLLLAVPWRTEIDAYGVARTEHQWRVYAPYPARLKSISPEGQVGANATLVVLDAPDISSRVSSSEANVRSYEARLSGLIADPGGAAEQTATRQRMRVQVEEAQAARSEIARLTLQAPFAGLWQDVNPGWQAGQWVGTREPLGILVDPSSWQIDAYVAQDQVQHLATGDAVRFYPDGQPVPLDGKVVAIGSTRTAQLSHRMLASHFGGPLATGTQDNALTPTASLFHVLVQLEQPLASGRETRGHLKIRGERRSLLADGATHLLAVVMRESGF